MYVDKNVARRAYWYGPPAKIIVYPGLVEYSNLAGINYLRLSKGKETGIWCFYILHTEHWRGD
jgi:hypothetical protein